MKAVIIDEFGGPEVLRVGDWEMPEPDAGQVRVRVRAAGVNGVDAAIRSGAAQQTFPTKLPTVLGLEIAGVVDASGPNVDGLAVGDEVLGFADGGGYAEYALATTVAPKPAELGWAEAAALPIADPAAFGLGVTFSGEAARDAGALAEVARWAADGRLRVTVGETYSLEEAPAAQESVASGHGRGKVVLLAD